MRPVRVRSTRSHLKRLFAHIPGLQVCMPTTHQDAYDLLLSSIWSDDPTVVIENRALYHAGKQQVRLRGEIASAGRWSEFAGLVRI